MRTGSIGRAWVPALALWLAAGTGTFAQSLFGTLSGAVLDPTEAVVAGADVSLVNEASGDLRRTKSNSQGFFTFAALPNGRYKLAVESPGFQRWESAGIVLNHGERRSVSAVKLALAGFVEEVSIGGGAREIAPVSSGEKSVTLTAEQIENIPLVGQNAAELLKILPGFAPRSNDASGRPSFSGEVTGINASGQGGNQSALGSFAGNGARPDAVDVTIDGAPANDPGAAATPVNPNPEMVQEFKVLQSNYGAENAKGPVAITAVSKAGGRDFHGSVFTYFRDYRLNSNEWYLNRIGSERPKNRYTFPGFTLSGPLALPRGKLGGLRDKAFFFVGYEYFQQRLDTGTIRSYVPTERMRNGDFSELPALGLSGSQVNQPPNFPGAIVPADLIDPGGRALLSLYPLPNADPAVTGGFNYVNNVLSDQNMSQLLTRLDVNVSERTRLFVRYNRQREKQPWEQSLWWSPAGVGNGSRTLPYPTRIVGNNKTDSVTASLTNVFNPTLTNELTFAYTFVAFPNELEDPTRVDRAALGYPYQGIFKNGTGQVPNTFGFWHDVSGGSALFTLGGLGGTLPADKWQYSLADNLTKVTGSHTLKAGIYLGYTRQNQKDSSLTQGSAQYLGAPWSGSGNGWAELLMGRVQSYTESSSNPALDVRSRRVEGYLQDSWKARPRLTLDLGVRVSYLGPWYDGSKLGVVVFDRSQYDPEAPRGSNSGLVWNAIDPRIPLSGVDGSFVYVAPRLGFAWDASGDGRTLLRGGAGIFRYQDNAHDYGRYTEFAKGRRELSVGPITLAEIDAIDPSSGSRPFGGTAKLLDDGKQPVMYSWSLTAQQRLPGRLVLEVGYVGNTQRDLQDGGAAAQVNPVPLGAMLGAPDGAQADDYRLLPNWGSLQVYGHRLYQNYNSLQTLLSRQQGRVTFTAAYTLSKALGIRDLGQGSSPFVDLLIPMRQTSYGVLNTDRTHVANLAWNVMLPDAGRSRLARALLNGWQVAGISALVSGGPLQGAGSSPSANFNMQGTLADGTQINNRNITGTDDVTAMPVLLCDPRSDVPDGYLFNPACFGPPSPGANGNYVWPYIKGPWYHNHDLSLFKNFAIGSRGHRLQLRASAYNVLNHPIAYPDLSTNLTLRFDQGRISDPDFGRLPKDNKYGRRIVQLALRYTF